jgi:alkyl sulfatase BDS1-like metallo-beta-lactamase superfamily hydrolase
MTQHDSPAGPKPASAATKAAQARAVLEQLPFSDQADFAQAQRRFIAPVPDGLVKNERGAALWDLQPMNFWAKRRRPIQSIPACGAWRG